jgi:AcrR family transcriptional regulator
MPRRAEYEARRHEITDALERITIKGGLQGVSFRQVADEAGISVATVQHYFATKDELLLAAWQHVSNRTMKRVFTAIRAVGTSAASRAVVHIVVDAFLPIDDERRDAALLFIAFHTASLTDRSLARAEAQAIPRQLADFIATRLEDAERDGTLAPSIDPAREAVVLLTQIIGIAHMVLSGSYTAEEGRDVMRYSVDRLYNDRPR